MRFVSTLLVLTTLLTVGASKEDAIDPVTRLVERLLPNHAGSNLIEFRGRHRDGGCAEGARCFSIQNGDKPGTISIAGSTGVEQAAGLQHKNRGLTTSKKELASIVQDMQDYLSKNRP